MNKIKEVLSSVLSTGDKRIKGIVLIGVVGMLLVLLSNVGGGDAQNTTRQNNEYDYDAYTQSLEKELEEMISSIDGVGRCKVMITLENTREGVYAKDVESKSDRDSSSQKDAYVFYDTGSDESPVLIKENFPKIQGVSVVCSGGDNAAVREAIVKTVTALFNLSANRISVTKIK